MNQSFTIIGPDLVAKAQRIAAEVGRQGIFPDPAVLAMRGYAPGLLQTAREQEETATSEWKEAVARHASELLREDLLGPSEGGGIFLHFAGQSSLVKQFESAGHPGLASLLAAPLPRWFFWLVVCLHDPTDGESPVTAVPVLFPPDSEVWNE